MKLKNQGGIRLTNLQARQDVIKISWIFLIEQDPFLEACAYDYLSKGLLKQIWKCNLAANHVEKLYDTDIFWAQVLKSWSKVNFCRVSVNKNDIFNQIIWLNSEILLQGVPVKWEHWIQKNIVKIKDLYSDDNMLKSHQELNVNWLEYLQLLSSIPDDWKKCIGENLEDICENIPLYDKLFFFFFLNFLLDQGPVCGATACSCFGLCVSFLTGFKAGVDLSPALFLACVR